MSAELPFICGKNPAFRDLQAPGQYFSQAVTWDASFARTGRSAGEKWENI